MSLHVAKKKVLMHIKEASDPWTFREHHGHLGNTFPKIRLMKSIMNGAESATNLNTGQCLIVTVVEWQ